MIQVKEKLNKITEYLLYAFVFLLPWQTRWIIFDPHINNGVWEYGRIALYGFDVIFIVLMIVFFALKISAIKRPPPNPLLRKEGGPAFPIVTSYLLLVICLLLINFIVAQNKLLNFYWWLRILQGVILIYLITKIKFSKIKLAWSFIFSMCLSAVLGIYQFVSQSAFAFKWLGLAKHLPEQLGTSVVQTFDGRWLRAYGSLPHPNILAGFILVAIILLMSFVSRIDARDKLQQESSKDRIFAFTRPDSARLAGMTVLVVGLFFTFSRAGWLAFLIMACVGLVFIFKNKKVFDFDTRYWLHITGFLLIVSCMLVIVFWPLVQTRIFGNTVLEVNSNIERMNGIEQSLEIIKNNPLFGVGLGNYTVALQDLNPGMLAWDYQPVHNIYLLFLSEFGILGLLVLIAGFFGAVKKYIKSELFKYNKILLFTFSSLFLFLFLFDHFWWTLPSGMLVVFLMVGVVRCDKK